MRKGREVHTRTLEMPIAAERHDLAITLTPDHDRYAPRDSARVRIETHDGGGRPVPAEVSVAVVDEAIFALKPDDTPDPHDVFYGRRPNAVTTAVAFPVMLFGGADKGGREEVRRDFRDVALWAPTVLTDANGRAEVGFRYPDNLTTWRVTSRGATDRTLVGKQVAKTLVTKDLVARLAGPRFLIAGDEAELVSVTTNRSDAPLVGVDASLDAQGPIALSGGASTKFNVARARRGRAARGACAFRPSRRATRRTPCSRFARAARPTRTRSRCACRCGRARRRCTGAAPASSTARAARSPRRCPTTSCVSAAPRRSRSRPHPPPWRSPHRRTC